METDIFALVKQYENKWNRPFEQRVQKSRNIFTLVLSMTVSIVAVALFCCLTCRRRRNNRQDEYEMPDTLLRDTPTTDGGEKSESVVNAECQTNRHFPLLSPFKRLETLYRGEVLNTMHIYFQLKILENNSLSTFLEERVHELFHLFKPRASCCKNTSISPCASSQRHSLLTEEQFLLLYEEDPSIAATHQQMDNRGRITQHCICPYKPNTEIDVSNLDITLMCLLKETCRRTPAGHPQWFRDVKTIRNHISHLGDDYTLSDKQCEEWRKRMEDAIINIAGTICTEFQRGVARRISDLNEQYLQIDDVKSTFTFYHAQLKHMITNALQNVGVQIGNLVMSINPPEFYEEKPKTGCGTSAVKSKKATKKCIVVWKFSSPGEWDVTSMQEKLDQMAKIGDFDIDFVYQKCLIVHTKLDMNILSDESQFKDSIEEFLFLFVHLFLMQAPKAQSLVVTPSMWLPIVKDEIEVEVSNRDDGVISLASSTKEDAPQEEKVTETLTEETQTTLALPPEEDKCRRKTVTELLEEDDQISSTLTEEEADFQKETAQEVMKEETLATSALQAEDTTHAQAPVKKSQLPRELKKIKQIDISGLFPDCTAVDDTFVICDYNNNRLVITDSDGSHVRDIALSGRPCRITAIVWTAMEGKIDNTTVAVRIFSDIDIINIYSGDRIHQISVDGIVRGFTYSDSHLYLGVDGKGIQVIDLHGYTIKTIPTKGIPLRMTLNKQNIYYTDGNTVSCVTTSGEKMWTFEDHMIKHIFGVTTNDTNIYVTCNDSHTVFVISPDGKQVRQLLCESDGLKHPYGICYNRKSKTLMVCSQNGPAYLFNIVK